MRPIDPKILKRLRDPKLTAAELAAISRSVRRQERIGDILMALKALAALLLLGWIVWALANGN